MPAQIATMPAGAADASPPFAARQPVENAEITLRDASGETRICLAHAVPVFDGENNWRGARPVGSASPTPTSGIF